jgi:DNA-binding MarR family transcriptional regulator
LPKELNMSAVENCVWFNLRWVTRVVTQFYDAEIRRHGIRPTQGSILASLQAGDSWSMADLRDWLGMERTTLVRNLRPLQRDGFVNVGGGGRGNLVALFITAKGRKQVEKLVPAWKSVQSAAVKTLGEKRWSLILSDLETTALALRGLHMRANLMNRTRMPNLSSFPSVLSSLSSSQSFNRWERAERGGCNV